MLQSTVELFARKVGDLNMKRMLPALVFVPLLPWWLASWNNEGIPPTVQDSTGSYFSGTYQNLFVNVLGKEEREVKTKVDQAFRQLFYGDDDNERVYYPVEPDMAYVEDILHGDVRSEGMSYGMMIAVQLDKKQEFDRIWKWAKTHMQHKTGPRKTYFAWHCTPRGEVLDSTAASDGEEWFVTALFFASSRWGDGKGMYNYRVEAQSILDAMLHQEESDENDGVITNMFNRKEAQVVFVPEIQGAGFTDPSYHLPHFYELWARWANQDNEIWCHAASTSRKFLKKTVHPVTGLAPNYARFDGAPFDPWNGGHRDFRFDAWRVAMNIAVDYAWFAKDAWQVTQSDRLLSFFRSQGIGQYGNQYTLDGKKLADDHSSGLVSMNAVACLAAKDPRKQEFLEELWNLPVPAGPPRYYDGLLYMLAMLQVSGNFKVYDLTSQPTEACHND
jgi:oligosaccharide reducing-end xylanase